MKTAIQLPPEPSLRRRGAVFSLPHTFSWRGVLIYLYHYHKHNVSAYKSHITEANTKLYPNKTQFNQGEFESNRIKSYVGFCQGEKWGPPGQNKKKRGGPLIQFTRIIAIPVECNRSKNTAGVHAVHVLPTVLNVRLLAAERPMT